MKSNRKLSETHISKYRFSCFKSTFLNSGRVLKTQKRILHKKIQKTHKQTRKKLPSKITNKNCFFLHDDHEKKRRKTTFFPLPGLEGLVIPGLWKDLTGVPQQQQFPMSQSLLSFPVKLQRLMWVSSFLLSLREKKDQIERERTESLLQFFCFYNSSLQRQRGLLAFDSKRVRPHVKDTLQTTPLLLW